MTPYEAIQWIGVAAIAMLLVIAAGCFYKAFKSE